GGGPDWAGGRRGGGFRFVGKTGEATERVLGHKNDRRKENEERHHFSENLLAGACEQNAAAESTQETYGRESFQPWFHARDLLAETIDTPGCAEDQGECAGGIGNKRRRSEEQKGGEGDKRTAAGHGVNHSRRGGRRRQRDNFRSRHVAREFGRFRVRLKAVAQACRRLRAS